MLLELINSKLIDLHGQEGHSTRNSLEDLVSLVAEVLEACLCHYLHPVVKTGLDSRLVRDSHLDPLVSEGRSQLYHSTCQGSREPELGQFWNTGEELHHEDFVSL